MPGAAYTTITSSLLAETLADTVIGPLVLLAAYASGRIPHLPALGHLAAFEWSFFASHAQWFALVLAAILILTGVFFTYLEHHVVVVLGARQPRPRHPADAAALLPPTWCRSSSPAGRCGRSRCTSSSRRSGSRPTSSTPRSRSRPRARRRCFRSRRAGSGRSRRSWGTCSETPRPASTVLAFSVGMQFAITLTSVLAGGAAIWITLKRLPWHAHRHVAATPAETP